jgi:hypothetical protein
MTERGLPIVDGAPACPFVAFEDERDERSTSPDHRHRCYAESRPAPRALAHQEAYCLSSAFPVCPTFQDWARREAARSRQEPPRSSTSMDAVAAGSQERNPPRSWAAPPPWTSGSRAGAEDEGTLWDSDGDDEGAAGDERDRPSTPAAEPEVPPRGRGLSGSFADRIAAADDRDDAADDGAPDADDMAFGGAAAGLAGAAGTARPNPLGTQGRPAHDDFAPPRELAPRPPEFGHVEGWDDELPGGPPEPTIRRRRERDAGRFTVGAGDERPGGGGRGGNRERREAAPDWERGRPLEAYPTLRSRRLGSLSVPPLVLGIVAVALAAAVLFALPGLLGFGSPQAGASTTPTTPIVTAIPSVNPTPEPAPTPVTYVVQSGDTMSRIAGRFGISLQDLIDANVETIPDPNKLRVGDVLVIPVPLPTELPAASEIPAAS